MDYELKNPIVEQRADPWVYKHTDGYYYFTASVPEFDRIELRRSKTIQGLNEAKKRTVWTKRLEGPMSSHIWAPEIHFINKSWYVYFAAARVEAEFDHRMYVLENHSSNPLEGQWTERGQVKTDWESFSLDATTFEHQSKRYYVWAQKDPTIEGNSNLYIAEMENPWTIKSPQVMLSKPEYDWEKSGFLVNEGAAVLKRKGKLFITYSASATDHHYCMGMLSADESSPLLDPASWTKSPQPVFQTDEKVNKFGPGHNSFTVSEDGLKDVLIYHARNYKEITGNPLYDPNRHTCAQPFDWDEDGIPHFGNLVQNREFIK
ncbi:glycoside hydrolase family 43 protein [Pullulanibacillus sp. KACC 23026]|uniref:glycoside hydrolase family 43 protein n=1 Tax=Pullulanibacillus sp. KACC 23026 TaxID=3028315 RepID=UPI0023AEFEE0|nr:glycoside hydrolase family 43 protein [Pullulanibacillus sp. KACC 23026]WEG11089.1 glycoside hydrolase family 43 protein [Pullulanibacillus sp. KACC 23026]